MGSRLVKPKWTWVNSYLMFGSKKPKGNCVVALKYKKITLAVLPEPIGGLNLDTFFNSKAGTTRAKEVH